MVGKAPQAPVFLFDIETVPDIPLLGLNYAGELNKDSGDFDFKLHWNDLDFYTKTQEISQKNFPPVLFHSVLSICGIFIDPISHRIMDGFRSTIPRVSSYAEFQTHEKKLLNDFWDFSLKHEDFHNSWYQKEFQHLSDFQKRKFKKVPVTFSGYNIAQFDLPVLEQRSLKYFVTCPIPDYLQNLGPDSYRYKYASDKVFDLLNYVSNYDNRNAKVGLNILAKSMGLGGKLKGMDGSKVAEEYFQNHNSDLIEEYCAVDVLISYGVYLAIQKNRGILNDDQFREVRKSFYDWLLLDHKPQSYKDLAKNSPDYFLDTVGEN